MNNSIALILDTETHSLNGLPIQIAHMPCTLTNGNIQVNEDAIYDQLFSIDQPIELAAIAIHHIIESDLVDKPNFKSFKLPDEAVYIIGHNIEYDIDAIARCGIDTAHLKPICTLALARSIFVEAPAFNLTTLSYYLSEDHEATRNLLKNAHNAKTDILLTAGILNQIIKKLNVQSIDALYEKSCSALIPTHIFFGKYKGTAIVNLPIDYVRWLSRQPDLDKNLRKALITAHGER